MFLNPLLFVTHRLDTFQSGINAASWVGANKSFEVYTLTKLSDQWFCQNKKCDYRQYGVSSAGAPNVVVFENGDLNEYCIYCNAQAKRATRVRKPSSKRRNNEE